MRKLLMTVATAVLLIGTTATTKAASLIHASKVSVEKQNENLVLQHANVLFSGTSTPTSQWHESHASHSSHESHSSHSSHYSSH